MLWPIAHVLQIATFVANTPMMIRFSRSFLLLMTAVSPLLVAGQDAPAKKKNHYFTTGGEIIFSWADASKNDKSVDVITRFSPVFNFQGQYNIDAGPHFGMFTGITIHNVGFIYDDPDSAKTRYKSRVYSLGIPVALKLGNMSGGFLFGGYELEVPFNYKEKKFVNDEKVNKFNTWFSDRTPGVYQTVFAGFQTSRGLQVKFKYFLTNFFNKDFAAREENSNNIIYPYKTFDANVFYVSLSMQINEGAKKKKKTAPGSSASLQAPANQVSLR